MRAFKGLFPLLLALFLLSGCAVLDLVAVDAPPADYVAQEDGFRYVKSTLTPQEQYVYDQLVAGLKDHAPRIEGLYPDDEMIQTAVQAIARDYPELFWFTGGGSVETTVFGSTPVSADYVPSYGYDADRAAELQASIDAWAADCAAGLPADASHYQKAIHVYQYLIDHADYQTVDSNSIVNIMVQGGGLCGCYAKTAQYLLNLWGVPCAYITGDAGGQSHAWNLVWLDGTPVWMDPTWGDPVFEGGDPNDGPAYEYFGLTTEELSRTHTIDDSVPVPDCVSRDYNYFLRNGLYLDWYQPDPIVQAMAASMAEGRARVPLQFAPDGYAQAKDVLFGAGEVYRLFREASAASGIPLDLGQSIFYTPNDGLYTLAIKIPYET